MSQGQEYSETVSEDVQRAVGHLWIEIFSSLSGPFPAVFHDDHNDRKFMLNLCPAGTDWMVLVLQAGSWRIKKTLNVGLTGVIFLGGNFNPFWIPPPPPLIVIFTFKTQSTGRFERECPVVTRAWNKRNSEKNIELASSNSRGYVCFACVYLRRVLCETVASTQG